MPHPANMLRGQHKFTYSPRWRPALAVRVHALFSALPHPLLPPVPTPPTRSRSQCVKHALFTEYPVLFDKEGTFVAQFKFTIMLLPSGNAARITAAGAPEATSELAVEDEGLKELLAVSTEKKKKNKPKKKKAAGEKEEDA